MSTGNEKATHGSLVWRLANKWRVAVDRALAPLGLTHAQYVVLASLHGMRRAGVQPPSQRRLADQTGLEALYVSKLARALESAGFLVREKDPRDPRAMRLTLTEEGSAVTRRAIGVVQGLLDQMLAPLGGQDSARAAAFADELRLLLETPLTLPGDAGSVEASSTEAGGSPRPDDITRETS
ncbi:MarR family winged helix-turn-helix transcriptional regulator [Streptomyces acidiscabies]|uniref:MarR family transcriptional regulator n=1 Tax=Streptomyces acidiscabies TaxID=42234 RepID=A0AAP6B4Y8_9ACTN|nr:MarR family transcriptional regulator [Streptomyces acidiscabies]MBP5941420.1 MarR family transcriptional regulator [Streptomyces sp. LBUM 1476]MBZ3912791.1 MarR family transcriptional regulator [Streptomyces acidiscabies]MDX2958275.1 MarR family transcriptional regulator [Streptomyces acidiscabies]MDX3018642.1 MarR family transcriptional regulator [Streptomyces acidiscabies]MDX3791055.1 MarR family transcriptional regulator [Streptomyces acidiscabies]